MIGSDEFDRALADDDAEGHGVAGGDARQDRSVRNAEVLDPVNLQVPRATTEPEEPAPQTIKS